MGRTYRNVPGGRKKPKKKNKGKRSSAPRNYPSKEPSRSKLEEDLELEERWGDCFEKYERKK